MKSILDEAVFQIFFGKALSKLMKNNAEKWVDKIEVVQLAFLQIRSVTKAFKLVTFPTSLIPKLLLN